MARLTYQQLVRAHRTLARENRRLTEQNQLLHRRVDELQGEIQQLKQQLEAAQRAGKRQAAPFAKRRPKSKPKKPGRKPGKAYGSQACAKPPKQIDETYDALLPCRCPHCRGSIIRTHVDRQYQIELPSQPIYRQFNVHVGQCRGCGKRVQGRHVLQTSDALGAAAVQLGPNAQVAVVHLNKVAGLSHGKVAGMFDKLFHIHLCRGASARIVRRVAERLKPTYQAIKAAMPHQPWHAVDETGWRIGGWPAWLHVFVSGKFTCYVIAFSRGHDVAQGLLGWEYSGLLIHDGWAPYDRFYFAQHQTCLAHLLRRCGQLLETAQRGAVCFPRKIKQLLQDALHLRDRYEGGQLSPPGLVIARGKLRSRLDRLLRWRRTDPSNERLAQHLARHRDQLFTFLQLPGVDATNWRGEQALRPAVVNRKVWGGNRTEAGAQAQAILMSVLRTSDQQAHNSLACLRDVLCAPRNGPIARFASL